MSGEEQLELQVVDTDRIQIRLDLVDAARAGKFTPIARTSVMPGGTPVLENSREWTGRFLAPRYRPYATDRDVKRSIHRSTVDSVDMLRHEYTVDELSLDVVETVQFVFIHVVSPQGAAPSPIGTPTQVQALADRILNRTGVFTSDKAGFVDDTYDWKFHVPLHLVDGSRFSTSPRTPLMQNWSWATRVDGGVLRGHLYFLGFKKEPATSGRVFEPDMQHWFDGHAWDALLPRPRP